MHIKVAITDDHLMLVNGLVYALKDCYHIDIIGTYGNGTTLLKGLAKEQPDVLLLDLQLPDYLGNELSAKIRNQYPNIRIIILTGIESTFHAKDILQQGCMGYLYKTSTNTEILVKAIEDVYAGDIYVDTAIKDQLISNIIRKPSTANTSISLTKREKEVLKLIILSHTSTEIAQKLFISHRTVECHRFSLMQKIGVKNTAGLVLKAVQLRLTE